MDDGDDDDDDDDDDGWWLLEELNSGNLSTKPVKAFHEELWPTWTKRLSIATAALSLGPVILTFNYTQKFSQL